MSAGLRAIGLAGVIAGALDLGYVIGLYAFKFPAVSAAQIVQGIAAGAIGREAASKGGLGTVALGIVLHFVIAFGAAAFFYALSRRLRVLVNRPWLSGALFGVAVWLVMNLAVLPLSATPPKIFSAPLWPWILAAHVLCVGVPIAFVVRWCAPLPRLTT